MTNYYKNFFDAREVGNSSVDETLTDDIILEKNIFLMAPYTEEKVNVVIQMEHNKAYGPDGF
jgi:hypothetical protein